MLTTTGKAYDHKGAIAVKTVRPPSPNLSDEVTVIWHDERLISPEQRRKAWALIGEIAAFGGYVSTSDKQMLNLDMKRKFLIERVDELTAEAIHRFSLSDVDMTTARLYITFLVDFCIEHGVPTNQPLWEMADDLEAYVYHCAMNKVCCICRRGCDLHHVDRVGMGRNRDDICHIGMEALPLCREHHMEAHQHGDARLVEKYHLEPIVIDEKIAKLYKLGKKERNA
jgi:hypothetical protein